MITTSQFIGYFNIAQDPQTESKLESYITRYEKKYLIDLLGFDLYELFVADLDVNGVPQTERFVNIYNALNYDENVEPFFYPVGFRKSKCDDNRVESEPTYSEGMVNMLLGFIFFEFVKEYDLIVSQTGVTVNVNENSENSPGATHTHLSETRYNSSIASYKVIQRYIRENESVYPEFKGTSKETTYWGGAF